MCVECDKRDGTNYFSAKPEPVAAVVEEPEYEEEKVIRLTLDENQGADVTEGTEVTEDNAEY